MAPEKTAAQAARGADPGIQEANLGKAVQTEKKKKKNASRNDSAKSLNQRQNTKYLKAYNSTAD